MDQKSQWASYWRMAWRERPRAKIFSPYRAIPGVLASAAQFLWKRKAHSSFMEMWITIAIIIAVYMILSTLEAIRNYVVISPVNLHSRQSETIDALTKENELLLHRQAIPQVSPQEERRRHLVSAEIKKLGEIGRRILRHIDDRGEVHTMALDGDFNEMAVKNFTARAIPSGLIMYTNHKISIKPE
ncbi:MAG: hypothetical protein WA604_10165, partial [Candidatus Sulfotelmatobacter sp.]